MNTYFISVFVVAANISFRVFLYFEYIEKKDCFATHFLDGCYAEPIALHGC